MDASAAMPVKPETAASARLANECCVALSPDATASGDCAAQRTSSPDLRLAFTAKPKARSAGGGA